MKTETESDDQHDSTVCRPTTSKPPTQMDTNVELLFLIKKLHSNGPFKRTLQTFIEECDELNLAPPRIDWKGNRHKRSINDLDKLYPHIQSDHLSRICKRIPTIVSHSIPPSVPGVDSLLGAGGVSVLRTKTYDENFHHTHLITRIHGGPKLPAFYHFSKSPNIVHSLLARECSGPTTIPRTVPTNIYAGISKHCRHLGHLSAVFCISFDRTGQYLFTGADDHLVKIWSTKDGRLLATLRGHLGEICDIAVNYENTMIAAASCDKMIRVWNIRNIAPISILQGHNASVSSVKFCPLARSDKRWLVSTGTEGTICFWSWNALTNQIDPKPKKFNEKVKSSCKIMCSSFSSGGVFFAIGSTDNFVRVYSMTGAEGPTKILDIEAHIDAVDSLQFSHLSLRFVSGSRDGIAKIWSYSRKEWKETILDMNKLPEKKQSEVEVERQDRLLNAEPRQGGTAKVNMVAWTCDDRYIITTVSDHSTKVWDSKDGRLIHVLTGHDDDAFIVDPHPKNPRIFLTGGHDGKIILWDAWEGKMIQSFYNQIDGQGHGSIFDCRFSPDGSMFAATDSHGHVVMYGFGDSKRYEKVPDAVFFHTDYRPLMRDANQYVIDEQTQCAPHLMPPPFLVDVDGNPYPPELQRLVPGREDCTDSQLVPYIAVQNENGVGEVLEPVFRTGDADEIIAVNPVNAQQERNPDYRPTIDDMIQRLQQERNPQNRQRNDDMIQRYQREQENARRVHAEHDYIAPPLAQNISQAPRANIRENRANQQQNGAIMADGALPRVAVRRAGDVEGVRQSSGNWQSRDAEANKPVWIKRAIVPPLSDNEVKNMYRKLTAHADAEEEHYSTESRKKQLPDASSVAKGEKKDDNSYLTRRKHRIKGQRQGVQGRQAPRRSRVIQVARPGSSGPPQGVGRGRGRSGILDFEDIADLDYDDSDDEDFRGSDAQSWSSETETSESEDSDSDFDSDASDGPRRTKRKAAGPGKRPRKTRKSPDIDEEMDIEDEVSPGKRTSGEKEAKLASKLQEINEKPLPEAFRMPEWLIQDKPRKQPLFPQIGDRVVYFRQGHDAYLEAVRTNNTYALTHNAKSRVSKNKRDEEIGEIIEISYDVKPPRLAVLKLAILDAEGNPTKEKMTLRYHDMPGVIEFVVLHQIYERAIQRDWKVNDRFKSIVDENWWYGTIKEISPNNEHFPHSHFLKYKVIWDSGEEERLSPWDMEELEDPNAKQQRKEKGKGIPALDDDLLIRYDPLPNEWPEHGRDEECNRILRGMPYIMENGHAEHFLTPVDFNDLPLYGITIPYPMDLSTIKTRLENRFYRRVRAIVEDAEYILRDAEIFNERGADIIRSARIIRELFVKYIQDSSCQDPATIYHQLMENQSQFDDPDDSESDSAEPKKKGRDAESRKSLTRKRLENNELTSKTWKKQCHQLINYLWDVEDSAPFRVPVDPIQYPDYNRIIETPMDLNTIRESLAAGYYETPQEFKQDMALIFKNSKTYNTCKKSQIYCMTVRLSNLFEEKFKEIMDDHKAARKYESMAGRRKTGKGGVKTSTDRKLKELEKYDNLVNSKSSRANGRLSSASIDPNLPSTSGYSASTSRAKDTKRRKAAAKTKKRLAESEDDDFDDEETEEEYSEEEVSDEEELPPTKSTARRRAPPKRSSTRKREETSSETEIEDEDSASETEIEEEPELSSPTSRRRPKSCKRKASNKLSNANKRRRKVSGDSNSSDSASTSTYLSDDSAATEVNSYESSRRTSNRTRKPRGTYSPDLPEERTRKTRACAKQRVNYSYGDEDYEFTHYGRRSANPANDDTARGTFSSSRGRVVKAKVWNRPLVESR